MAAAAILKNLKIAISQPHFGRFWRNLARWCSSTLLTAPTVKNWNLKFSKSKMAAAAILKNWIIAISQPRFNRFWPNLACSSISNLLTVPTVKNSKFQKIQDGGDRHLEKTKNAISHPRFNRFRPNLAWWSISNLLTVLTVKNYKFQKSKMAAAASLKN